MTQSVPTSDNPVDPDDVVLEELRPVDPEDAVAIDQDGQPEMVELGEADAADVAEQEAVVEDDEDGYQRAE